MLSKWHVNGRYGLFWLGKRSDKWLKSKETRVHLKKNLNIRLLGISQKRNTDVSHIFSSLRVRQTIGRVTKENGSITRTASYLCSITRVWFFLFSVKSNLEGQRVSNWVFLQHISGKTQSTRHQTFCSITWTLKTRHAH